MCSTPRPKVAAKGKAVSNGGVLANMNIDVRSRFAERANLADEKRYQISLQKKQQVQSINQVKRRFNIKVQTNSRANINKGIRYWLGTASIKEIFLILFIDKAKNI